MSRRVLVLGSINVDLTAIVSQLPGRGETVMGGELAVAFGGKGANQAVAAARAGAPVALLGCVGDDSEGARYLEALAGEGVATGLVRAVPGVATGTALILVEGGSGENMIAVCPGANSSVSCEDVEAAAAAIADSAVVCAQLEVPLQTVICAAHAARAAGVPFVLNPSPVPAEGVPAELLKALDYLVCNETEITQIAAMSGLTTPDDAVATLLGWGLRAVFVTRGAEGCTVMTAQDSSSVPAFPVKSVDAVGAGDAFAGAVCAGLAEGRPLAQIALFANAAGALAVQTAGAMPSLPTREAIVGLLNESGCSLDWA